MNRVIQSLYIHSAISFSFVIGQDLLSFYISSVNDKQPKFALNENCLGKLTLSLCFLPLYPQLQFLVVPVFVEL